MMEKANISIAMGNAVEEIKAMCKYETLSNEEHGVAHALYINVIKRKRIHLDSFSFISKVFYEIHRSLITFYYIEYIGINVYIFHKNCEYFMNFILIACLYRY